MTSIVQEHFFATRDEASVAAAGLIVTALQQRLLQDDTASLVVTGGTGPGRCYAELAASKVNWPAVQIVLSDERWVPATDNNSNEKLVRDTLLVNRAAGASLLPMYAANSSPVKQCQQLNAAIAALPQPFACTLLGMGADGHIASLFPDAANLVEGLDLNNPNNCIPVATASSEHARISLTLATLLRSDKIALLFFGAAKRAVYEKAKAASADVPVATLLSQTRVPVHVFWSD